ncbi:unnamed protein product, partial [Staurois parvus]
MNAAARLLHLTSHSMSATPLCQSLHWLPFSVLHPSLPIPPLASIPPCQSLHWLPLCPPSLSANPSTGLHPSLPIPPLASIQCPPSLSANQSLHWPPSFSANPSTGFHSVSSISLC